MLASGKALLHPLRTGLALPENFAEIVASFRRPSGAFQPNIRRNGQARPSFTRLALRRSWRFSCRHVPCEAAHIPGNQGSSIFSGGSVALPSAGDHAMHDVVRDWRRWRFEERITAVLIFGLVMSVPFAFAMLNQLSR
jgi:hypothetical protein